MGIKEGLAETRHAELVQPGVVEAHNDLAPRQPAARGEHVRVGGAGAARVAGGEEDEPCAVGESEAVDAECRGDAGLDDRG